MGKVTRGKKVSKGGISSEKKKNILKYKQGKQGILNKAKQKANRKIKRAETKKVYYAQLANKRKDDQAKQEIEAENQFKVTDVTDMIDEENMEALLGGNTYLSRNYKNTVNIESNYDHEGNKPITKFKDVLPVATDEGWEEKTIEVAEEQKELDKNSKYIRKIPLNKKDEEVEEEEKPASSDEELEEEEEDFDINKIKSVSEILVQRDRRIHKKKVRLACIATNIIKDSSKIGNLEALMAMYTETDPLVDPTLMRHCLMTILQVFHRIIPGYRIQEKALNQTVKKDTFLIVKTELAMLKCYRQYLQALEDLIKKYRSSSNNIALKAVCHTAISCFGELLIQHSRFNYNTNIAQTLIPVLNFSDPELRKIALDAICQTIRTDKKCGIALDIVRKIYKILQKRKFRAKPDMVQVFMSLRVKEMKNSDSVVEKQRKSSREMTHSDRMLRKLGEKNQLKKSKKQKKLGKKMAKIRDKMADLTAKEMMDETNENHSEILKIVFGVYIHILKKKPNSKLMACVLEGLAFFSHLINIEFFSDLLSLMGSFLENGTLGVRESLHCIQTVFTILSGQGQYLTIDPSKFYLHTYDLMVKMKISELQRNWPVVLKIVHQMLIQRKKRVTEAKVLSFVKRLSTIAINLQHDAAIPTLLSLKELFSTFSYAEVLLDPNPEGCAGVFKADIVDPEHSNAGATAVWELRHLTRHYQPYVRMLSNSIINGTPLRESNQLNFFLRKELDDVFEDFDLKKLKLKPSIPLPEAHLKNSRVKKGNKKLKTSDLQFDEKLKKWIVID